MSEQETQQKILEMAAFRGTDKTICPSEVARELFPDNWRKEMQHIRNAAFDLAGKKQVIIMQKGKQVDPAEVKGPIRIRIQKTE